VVDLDEVTVELGRRRDSWTAAGRPRLLRMRLSF